jgi:hypothetical protein
VQITPKKAHGAGVASDESEQNAHQRCFPSAVRAEEPMQLTRSSDQIDACKDFAISVTL